jgi:hypothetical protein
MAQHVRVNAERETSLPTGALDNALETGPRERLATFVHEGKDFVGVLREQFAQRLDRVGLQRLRGRLGALQAGHVQPRQPEVEGITPEPDKFAGTVRHDTPPSAATSRLRNDRCTPVHEG